MKIQIKDKEESFDKKAQDKKPNKTAPALARRSANEGGLKFEEKSLCR